jgi:hypothetical protein
MKARDIIAGWPKGRSTSTSAATLPPWMYRYNGTGIDWDIERYLATLEADAEYHATQQKKVDDFRACGAMKILRECCYLKVTMDGEDYRLGNATAAEWALAQYLEKMREEIYNSLPLWDRQGCFRKTTEFQENP